MRFRISLAFCLSVLLIGVASWQRFAVTRYQALPSLVAGRDFTRSGDVNSLDTASIDDTIPDVPSISGTDRVGRGLLMDYVSLAQTGEANTTNINYIADQYVESIPTLIKFEAVSPSDLKTSSDNRDDVWKYAAKLWEIVLEHENKLNNTLNSKKISSAEDSYSVIGGTSSIYADTVSKLKNLPVPPALASVHTQLINTELSSLAATKAVAEMSADPASGFAGLVIFNNNLDNEVGALAEIRGVLGLKK